MPGFLILLAAALPPASVQAENWIAFARLYGYVRFFHPSDEASRIDWEKLAVYGAERVRATETTEELKSALEAVFLPIAPTVRVFRDGDDPKEPLDLWPADTGEWSVIVWQHKGVGLGSGSIYDSIRTNRPGRRPVASAGFGTVTQALPVSEHRGRRMRLRAAVRTAVEGPRGAGQLWARVDLPGGEVGFFDNMSDRPIRTEAWQFFEIEGRIDENAERLVFGGFLRGTGSIWLDDFEVLVESDTGLFQPLPVVNPGFEGGASLDGWGATSPGYSYRVDGSGCHSGERCALIETMLEASPPRLFDGHPEVGEVASKRLARGLRAEVPLALYGDAERTYGGRDVAAAAALERLLDSLDIEAADETSVRVGALVVAWNVFQHFYPYFDVVDTDWEAVLSDSIGSTLEVADEEAFERVLKRLAAALQDGHANAFRDRSASPSAYLPITVDWIESRVVVTESQAPGVERGAVVVRLNGVPAAEVLKEAEALISGSPQWKRHRALTEFGRGPEGTAIEILLEGEEAPRSVTRNRRARMEEPRPERISELEPGIHYVDLTQALFQEIRARLPELATARGVVFDMRGYPQQGNHEVLSHLSDEPLQCARWMVPRIAYPDREKLLGYDTSGRWSLPAAAPRIRRKVVFLTNAGAISYAETLMGIVEHYELGEIVGQPTAGANGNVNSFSTPGGYQFTFTGMRVIKHDDGQHHLIGILPTVPVERTIAAVREGRDEYLEKALRLLR
jgi:Peptidase family S41